MKGIFYHASGRQEIKEFKHFPDTSGNNKGDVIFAAKDPSFAAAFGVRWNDANARLNVETTDTEPPRGANYARCVLNITKDVDLSKPASMYKLEGDFDYLRYDDDLEFFTTKPVKILSEEKFDTMEDMAKAYDLVIKKVDDEWIMKQMQGKKTSNFKKAPKSAIDKVAEDLSRFLSIGW